MSEFDNHLNRIEGEIKKLKDEFRQVVSSLEGSRLMNYDEAAQYMGISAGYLRALKNDGKIECYQPTPRTVRFSLAQCNRFLAST